MSFDYAQRTMWLRDIGPGFNRWADYPLCEMHADRLAPPASWSLDDGRSATEPPLFFDIGVA